MLVTLSTSLPSLRYNVVWNASNCHFLVYLALFIKNELSSCLRTCCFEKFYLSSPHKHAFCTETKLDSTGCVLSVVAMKKAAAIAGKLSKKLSILPGEDKAMVK